MVRLKAIYLANMKLDLEKEYKTADGRKVLTLHRFKWTDNAKTIFAEIIERDEFVVLVGYYEDGTYFGKDIPSTNDLVQVLGR